MYAKIFNLSTGIIVDGALKKVGPNKCRLYNIHTYNIHKQEYSIIYYYYYSIVFLRFVKIINFHFAVTLHKNP